MRISDWSSDVCSSDLILALIHQHLRFVLEALDLIVDLAQRSRRGEQVLPIVGRVEHADLRRCRGARQHPGTDRADRAGSEQNGDDIFLHGASPSGERAAGKAASSSTAQSRPAWVRKCAANSSSPCRSEEHTSELQSLMRISYAVFCLKKKQQYTNH